MKTHVHHLERNFNNVEDNVDCAIFYFLVSAFNANTDSNKGESSKEEIVSHSDVGNWEDGSCTVYTPETFVQFTKKCKTTSSPSPETKLYQKFLKTANRGEMKNT